MPDSHRVAIVYHQISDADTMAQAGAILDRFGVEYEESVIAAHRSPRKLMDWATALEPRGVEVVIAGAGIGAALAGMIAAHTVLPVIGVPLRGGLLDGSDALYAVTQMPAGVPVAAVGVGHCVNAAVLAVQILAISDPSLRAKLWDFKDSFEKSHLE